MSTGSMGTQPRLVVARTPQGLTPVTTLTLVPADAVISGRIQTPSDVQVSGRLEGDVRARSVSVDAYGVVAGRVSAEMVVVQGHVLGEIWGGRVRLMTGCRVSGDVMFAVLEMEHGAALEGRAMRVDAPLPDLTLPPVARA